MLKLVVSEVVARFYNTPTKSKHCSYSLHFLEIENFSAEFSVSSQEFQHEIQL
jgi:hypothetical protein